jgi:hypothetical protein
MSQMHHIGEFCLAIEPRPDNGLRDRSQIMAVKKGDGNAVYKEKNMTFFPYTSLSTIVAVLVYMVLSINVGRARKAYGIVAPAVSGHIEFEKRYRVQMNTVEQFIIFLPVLWLSAVWVGDEFAAIMGLVWSVGRIVYARGYYASAEKRGGGFGIGALATIGMLLATIHEIVKSVL